MNNTAPKLPWICPVCREPLLHSGNSLVCSNRHCFDISKAGYVNLLLSSSRGGHGDDKLMVKSRTDFLNRGYYEPLARCAAELAGESTGSSSLIVDAGCGEGYYSQIVAQSSGAALAGIDISKVAVAAAAKRCKNLCFAAASTADMPLESLCADLILNIFSPLFPEEFRRVLKRGGKLLRVVPGEKHLWELKSLVYDRPYENPAPELEIPGFELLSSRRLEYSITLEDRDSILSLFKMTPYYYKTGEKDQQKLLLAETLSTRLEFEISLYKA